MKQNQVDRTQGGTAKEGEKSAVCLGMGNCAASILMGLFYAIAPIVYVLKYDMWFSNLSWHTWLVISILTGVFLYASFLCTINACFPSAIYCKQLEFIQHKLWMVLAIFAGVCLLLSISQFAAKKKSSIDLESRFDDILRDVYKKCMVLMEDNENKEAQKALDEWLQWYVKFEYTAACGFLIFAVVGALFAVIIWAIETQFGEMAAHIYEQHENDFKQAELFAEKMRQPDSPKCCCCLGNMVASLLMFLIYLLPLIAYCVALKQKTLEYIVGAVGTTITRYFPYLFHGFLIIQVLVFLFAAILSLINAINPSMWCCTHIRNISTYLIILVSIFSCITIGLALYQMPGSKYGNKDPKEYQFEHAPLIEDAIDKAMFEMYKKSQDAELAFTQMYYANEKDVEDKVSEVKAQNEKDEKNFRKKLKEDGSTARKFFAAAGIIGVIFILGLKYMESQFQAMCVFLYGYDIYEQHKAVEDALNEKGIAGP